VPSRICAAVSVDRRVHGSHDGLALPTNAQQSTGEVRGTVRHAASSAPMGSVQVTIAGTRLGAMSKDDGSFVIMNVPAGAQRVQARLRPAPVSHVQLPLNAA
jgi:hypothetical protein